MQILSSCKYVNEKLSGIDIIDRQSVTSYSETWVQVQGTNQERGWLTDTRFPANRKRALVRRGQDLSTDSVGGGVWDILQSVPN